MALNTLSFTASTTWTVPNGVYLINDVFVVGGGGGGGGGGAAGGGGGGQYNFSSNYATSPGSTISVVIGNGGTGSNPTGGSGQSSSFGSVSAGGGTGGTQSSGGNSGSFTGGSPSTTGGITGNANRVAAGGGAGSTQNGFPGGYTGYPGAGGSGYKLSWNGNYYGGGGGGTENYTTLVGGQPVPAAPGGLGGGGNGNTGGNGGNGTANTGGGGGGGSYTGGTGGNGIVVIRYYDPTFSLVCDKPGIAEGDTVVVTLRTTNVANGSVVNYTLSGSAVTNADFASGSLSGSFTVTSTDNGGTGTATSSITLINDSTTEGNEVVTLSLTNGLASTTFLVGDSSVGGIANITSKTISQADYNDIRNKVVNVLGPGSGNTGWGQSVLSSAVAEGNTVSINEWGKLKYDIINAWIHIYGTTPSLSTPSAGNTVVGNALSAPYAQYNSYANAIVTNRANIPAVGQYITRSTPPAPRNEVWTYSYVSSWTTRLISLVSVSFSNSDQARYFFNSGGEIRFTTSRSAGANSPQNNAWSTLLTSVGTVRFGAAKPGGLSGSGVNFYTLNTNFQTFFSLSASTPYSANTFRISARTPGITNTNGTASSFEFYIEWTDDHLGNADIVDGVLNLSVSTLEATGVLQPSGSGYFAVESPVINSLTITPG